VAFNGGSLSVISQGLRPKRRAWFWVVAKCTLVPAADRPPLFTPGE